MLNKLLKHEFRATGRVMLPTLGALLLLSVMAGISMRVINGQPHVFWVLGVVMRLLQLAFLLSLFAVFILVVVLIVYRFYKSLMGDEGYLSFTLPVSADGHIWSKLITALVWMAAVVVVCIVSAELFFIIGGKLAFSELPDFAGLLRNCAESYGVGNTALFVLEVLIAIALTCFVQCLHFYAAIALGGCSAKNKKLLAVVAYFVISALRNVLFLSSTPLLVSRGLWQWLDMKLSVENLSEAVPAFHIVSSGGCLVLAVTCAVYYLITRFCMTRKLNLA